MREGHRSYVEDATAVACTIACDGAVLNGEHTSIIDAVAEGSNMITRDGAVLDGEGARIVDAVTNLCTAIREWYCSQQWPCHHLRCHRRNGFQSRPRRYCS